MKRTALIAGITGIGGNHVARELLANGWEVVGLSRRPPSDLPAVRHVAADLLDPAGLGRSWRNGSACRPPVSTGRSSPSSRRWRTTTRSGARSPSAMAWRNPTSTAWLRPGTPTSTSGGRWR
ncbi:NAD-dependent epimerase/dehydratase family protein [Massilia sp. ST3]|nr:NAD-dependent epimerase/dehydratase family protein [Massilia sp. ST3]